MSMTRATVEVELKAAQLKETAVVAGHRVLEFYASAFTGKADRNGDIMDPKAFDKWLPEFYAAKQALPISFNHAAILDGNDPTNVVGYAPADPDHVWVDDYGLRVKAYLDVRSEKGKAVEYQVEKGLLTGASLAFGFMKGDTQKIKEGTLIKSVTRVLEAGLVPNPAEQAAVLLWMKSEGMTTPEHDAEPVPYMSVEEFRQVILKQEPDPLDVQHRHDELVAAGAVCASVEKLEELTEVVKAEAEVDEDKEALAVRMRRLRALQVSLP